MSPLPPWVRAWVWTRFKREHAAFVYKFSYCGLKALAFAVRHPILSSAPSSPASAMADAGLSCASISQVARGCALLKKGEGRGGYPRTPPEHAHHRNTDGWHYVPIMPSTKAVPISSIKPATIIRTISTVAFFR